jgi:hypothetical protein
MRLMKKISMILAVLLSGVFTLSAQKLANDGLVLTGSVQGIEADCVNREIFFVVRLYMQFRNDGDSSLILLPPNSLFEPKINFTTNDVGDPTEKIVEGNMVRYDLHLERPFGRPFRYKYDPFPSFINRLDESEPPFKSSGEVVKIEPGAYHEFTSTLWVKNGFHIGTTSAERLDDCKAIRKATPIPEYPSFRVRYHLSLKKYDQGRDLLELLQVRWKRFGHLLLDDDGDVTFRSEKILLPLN